ncbi:MAG: Acetyltransferase [Marmoricola sp.]|nr:Acetyltransferase [Marmoricola sp.]
MENRGAGTGAVVCHRRVEIELSTPGPADLGRVLRVLGSWQAGGAPVQLHPGDLGWFGRHGAEATAAALRTWNRDGDVQAIGFLDGPGLVRLTTAPGSRDDAGLADRIRADLDDPGSGVLDAGAAAVETPTGSALAAVLLEWGWSVGESWTPLVRALHEAVEPVPGVEVHEVGPEEVADAVAVHRSAFASTAFTPERWRTLTGGPAYADARGLLALDELGRPVAWVVVWSAGPGRPGLLEPMGVHAEHRGRGHGRAVCLAAASALQQLGSSHAMVCTPTANVAAVATYGSAGYRRLPERRDRARPAAG